MPVGEWAKNVVIFGVGNSSSRHTGDILVLSEGPADGLNDTAIMAEGKYLVKINKSRLISSMFMHVTTFKEMFQNDQTLEKSRRFKIYDRIQNYLTILGLQA